jgi:hypothetical protein
VIFEKTRATATATIPARFSYCVLCPEQYFPRSHLSSCWFSSASDQSSLFLLPFTRPLFFARERATHSLDSTKLHLMPYISRLLGSMWQLRSLPVVNNLHFNKWFRSKLYKTLKALYSPTSAYLSTRLVKSCLTLQNTICFTKLATSSSLYRKRCLLSTKQSQSPPRNL